MEGLSGDHTAAALDKLLEILRQKGADSNPFVDTVFDELARLVPNGVPQDDMTALSLGWSGEQPPVSQL